MVGTVGRLASGQAMTIKSCKSITDGIRIIQNHFEEQYIRCNKNKTNKKAPQTA